MEKYEKIKYELTILVNSCDKYEDLWIPFFTLLKKYWQPIEPRIILNTETKIFSMDGLKIECIHPVNPDDTYGQRMINVLSKITTPYVIPFLDDFFIRKNVDLNMINDIMKWMDSDKSIVYFNCDHTPTYYDWERDKYPGFHRIPYGNVYTLNMQAAIWRTEKLRSYWLPEVSPWEWEEYTNLIAAENQRDKFYCVSEYGNGFCDYGYDLSGMGVHHGKWVKDDVIPLFEREGIAVDLSKRGFLEKNEKAPEEKMLRETFKSVKSDSMLIRRCLTGKHRILYFLFVKGSKVIRGFKYAPEAIYIHYSLLKSKEKFYKMIRRQERRALIKKNGLINLFWRKLKP